MVLNYLFTGLIAALMAVPGTGQKEVATVGEEPVVKKEVKTLTPVTFYHKGSGLYERNPGSGTNCQPLSSNPCKIIYEDENDVEDVESFTLDDRPMGESQDVDQGIWQ